MTKLIKFGENGFCLAKVTHQAQTGLQILIVDESSEQGIGVGAAGPRKPPKQSPPPFPQVSI